MTEGSINYKHEEYSHSKEESLTDKEHSHLLSKIVQQRQHDEESAGVELLDVVMRSESSVEEQILAQINEKIKGNWIDSVEEGEIIDEKSDLTRFDIACSEIAKNKDLNNVILAKSEPPRENILIDVEKYLEKQFELERKRKKLLNSKGADKKSVNISFSNLRSQRRIRGTKKPLKFKQIKGEGPDTSVSKIGKKACAKQTLQVGKKRKISKGLSEESDPEYIPSDESNFSSQDEEDKKPRFSRTPSNRRGKIDDDGDIDVYHERLKSMRADDEGFKVLGPSCKIPLSIWNKLYQYQKEGVEWLCEQDQLNIGAILGDEMGLGKTVQIVALLAGLHFGGHLAPSLIVCPTTIMHHWVREFHNWIPPLRVAILHESGNYPGKDRKKLVKVIQERRSGILVTSYSGIVQHKETILCWPWHYVVLDEGHKIRNPNAKVTVVIKEIDSPHRLILSGSPLQNNLKELWSLMDFIFPGRLGSLDTFVNEFAAPITQGAYANASHLQVVTGYKCAVTLRDLVTPHLLRRSKAEVGVSANLPCKTEQVLFCKLTSLQLQLYNDFVSSLDLSEMAQGSKRLFSALTHLRKICNHPDLFAPPPQGEEYGKFKKAGKMIVVDTLLRIWKNQGHRVLLFSQGIRMLNILEQFLTSKGYSYLRLDGGTSISARQPLIDKFNKDNSYFAMLLTTKVGGLGINLTGADRVVIYDPDWNPATDTQARERAWRIGQLNPVTIYRLITAATIEEKIYHRQIYKQFLSNRVLKDPRQRRFFKSNDLMELFSPATNGGTTETAAIFAGTSSEVNLTELTSINPSGKSSLRKYGEISEVPFSQHKIEKMKMIAKALSKRIGCQNQEVSESNDSFSMKKLDEGKSLFNTFEESSSSISDGTEKIKMLEQDELEKIVGKDCDKEKNEIVEKVNIRTKSVKSAEPKKDMDCECSTDNNQEGIQCLSTTKNCARPGTSKETKIKDTKGSNRDTTDKTKRKKAGKIKSTKLDINVDQKSSEFIEFEGETVPHLLKYKRVKKRSKREDNDNHHSEDNYVLHKLFSKSGIETAMKHDSIMEGGPSDYAIVEAEAEKVAQDALKALKDSRPSSSSSFSVVVNKKGPRSTGDNSSSSLLDGLKNKFLKSTAEFGDRGLLREIIAWLRSQGGTVSTKQLVSTFSSRVTQGKSPLFRSFLANIASFNRGLDGLGYWTIKEEFKNQPY